MIHLRMAFSMGARLRGLLGGLPLKADEGLWLLPCRAVHTFGMAYAIDIVFLDSCGRVLRCVDNVPPRRLVACLRAHSVIELPADTVGRHSPIFKTGWSCSVFAMNKAFVKESDQDDDDDLGSEVPALPTGTKNYMTTQGYRALRDELMHLINKERPDVVQVVSWAASNGDRSENGDYIYGKKRLREIDRRIRFLTKRLEAAEVVDPSTQPNRDQVFFGATVVYCDKAGLEHRVTIVGVDEAEPLQGKISWISPVARALIKAKEGDTITLRTPAGLDELDILEVIYPDPA